MLAATPAMGQPVKKDLGKARALDKEGARAYGEGRYADAIKSFDESYRLGGPAFELWNVAKCHLRLDEPALASEYLEKYLATPNLPKDDRASASAQLDALKNHPSQLTVNSSPSGAAVKIDGKDQPGVTPLTVTIGAGPHTIVVSTPTGIAFTQRIEARYGRALNVEAELKEGGPPRPEPPENPYAGGDRGTISLRAAVSVVGTKFGSVGGPAGAGFMLAGTYQLATIGKGTLSVGAVFTVSGDHWGNDSGVSNATNDQCVISNDESATAISFFGIGRAMFPIAENLTLGGMAGVGLTGLSHDELGGDVFDASCKPSTGLRPAFLLGPELDYALGSIVRLAAFPLTWHLQPAFDDARGFPHDATGVWMRFGVGIGAGVDL